MSAKPLGPLLVGLRKKPTTPLRSQTESVRHSVNREAESTVLQIQDQLHILHCVPAYM